MLAAFSVAISGLAANWLAAALLAFTIFFYVVIYTMWLKPRTAQNIVIGGAAGALPPVVGWAAMTGQVSLEPLVYFLIIFMWTPPHFWALALFTRDDYARAGIPMMPNVAGDESTATADPRLLSAARRHRRAPMGARLCRCRLTARQPFCLAPSSFAALSSSGVERDADSHRAAKRLFGYSILYLFGLFGVRLVEAVDGWTGRWLTDMGRRGSLLPSSSGGAAAARWRSLILLAVLVVLFYVMAIMHGPSIVDRPL